MKPEYLLCALPKGVYPRPPLFERFCSKIGQSGDCWVWTAGKRPFGHGEIRVRGRELSTHRLMYAKTKGNIPSGLWVLHRCDTPSCVNPAHLFLGTPKDNTHDAVTKGRMAKGERNGMAKLARTQIQAIRTVYRQRRLGPTIIAELVGVSRRMVLNIVQNKNWQQGIQTAQQERDLRPA